MKAVLFEAACGCKRKPVLPLGKGGSAAQERHLCMT